MNFKIAKEMTRALDAYTLREKAITNNLANADTPGYKRKYVEFESLLNKKEDRLDLKGKKTHPRHFDIPTNIERNTAYMVTDNSVSTRLDGNNVNVDVESAESAKNYINYSVVSQNLSGYYSSLLTGITGGRK